MDICFSGEIISWLNEIIERVMSVFPRITMLAPYEAGIKITLGKKVRPLGAGWYVWWPMIHNVVSMEIQSQVVDLRTQSVRTIDNRDVVVSGAIQYSINNIERATCNVQSLDGSLETLALGIILEFVGSVTLDECQDLGRLKSEILRGTREAARGWGVKIERIYITDLGIARNIRLLSNAQGRIA